MILSSNIRQWNILLWLWNTGLPNESFEIFRSKDPQVSAWLQNNGYRNGFQEKRKKALQNSKKQEETDVKNKEVIFSIGKYTHSKIPSLASRQTMPELRSNMTTEAQAESTWKNWTKWQWQYRLKQWTELFIKKSPSPHKCLLKTRRVLEEEVFQVLQFMNYIMATLSKAVSIYCEDILLSRRLPIFQCKFVTIMCGFVSTVAGILHSSKNTREGSQKRLWRNRDIRGLAKRPWMLLPTLLSN